MKRKVAQIGPSSLMVSLPTKWAKEHNVRKGDELFVDCGVKKISYSKQEAKKEQKEIEVDITNMSSFSLHRYLEVLYLTNYTKIVLTYKDDNTYSHKSKKNGSTKVRIKLLSNRGIGMEIVSQTKNRTELRCFLLDEEKDLQKIEKRIYWLFKETVKDFLESLDGTHHEYYKSHYDCHDNIIKFITYYLRVLDQSDKSEEEKKLIFALYLVVDKMLDKFRHVNEMIAEHGCSKRVKNHLTDIFDLIDQQFMALFKGKINEELVARRYEIVHKINKTKYTSEELFVIAEIKIFLDTINDFSRVIIVRGL